MKPRTPFRRAALERLASPEQLDALLQLAPLPTILARAAAALLFTSVVLWVLFVN